MSVQSEIEKAAKFGEHIESLVVNKGQCPAGDREILLIGYWSLIFDFHKGIISLLSNGYCGSAFALLRSMMEVNFRAHFVLMGTEEEIQQLQKDEYRVSFKTLPPRIDAAFGYNGLLQRIADASSILHSYTHGGTMQLGRRFVGTDVTRITARTQSLE